MAIVDDQGRLFGRLNLIDAVVAIFCLGLIPLLYGAAALFWTPLPTLTSIEPATIVASPAMRVVIKGDHFRPYMRVSFGNSQGQNFLFRSTKEAEVNVGELPPGKYDVILYDIAQERARLTGGFTVLPTPLPPTRMTLVGMIGNLDVEHAKQLIPGTTISGIGIIRKVAAPVPASVRVTANGLAIEIPQERAVMVPAEIEGFCEVRTIGGIPFCQSNGITLQPTMMLFGDHQGKVPFQIDQVRGPAPLVAVQAVLRLAGTPQMISQLRVGDVDANQGNPLAAGATIASLQVRHNSDSQYEADVTLRLNVEHGPNGWVYASAPMRAGMPLALRTPRYEMQGVVQSVTPEWSASPQ